MPMPTNWELPISHGETSSFSPSALGVARSSALRTTSCTPPRTGCAPPFVARPGEYGPHQIRDFEAEHDFDFIAADFVDLAAKLGTA